MAITLHQASIPVFVRVLGNLRRILEKAAAHAEAHKIDPAALLGARLFPDMFALTRQVQIASDLAKGGAARLAGVEVPSYEDKEASFPELLARIDKTVAFVNTIRAEQVDGQEQRAITLQMRSGAMSFKGQGYLLDFVLPNLYFHAAMTYAILRHNGVALGKADFLGG